MARAEHTRLERINEQLNTIFHSPEFERAHPGYSTEYDRLKGLGLSGYDIIMLDRHPVFGDYVRTHHPDIVGQTWSGLEYKIAGRNLRNNNYLNQVNRRIEQATRPPAAAPAAAAPSTAARRNLTIAELNELLEEVSHRAAAARGELNIESTLNVGFKALENARKISTLAKRNNILATRKARATSAVQKYREAIAAFQQVLESAISKDSEQYKLIYDETEKLINEASAMNAISKMPIAVLNRGSHAQRTRNTMKLRPGNARVLPNYFNSLRTQQVAAPAAPAAAAPAPAPMGAAASLAPVRNYQRILTNTELIRETNKLINEARALQNNIERRTGIRYKKNKRTRHTRRKV